MVVKGQNIRLDRLLLLPYLAVDEHEVLEALGHVGLVDSERLLLLPDAALHGGALIAQALDGGGLGILGCRGFGLGLAPETCRLGLALGCGRQRSLHNCRVAAPKRH